MSYKDDFRTDDLDSFGAYLDSFEKGPDEALRQLEGKTDPDSLRRRLRLLVDSKRFKEAADLVRGRTPHERWCSQAVRGFVLNGEVEGARTIIEWASSLEDLTVRRQCIVFFANSLLSTAFRDRGEDEDVLPGAASQTERAVLEEALDSLEPILMRVAADRRASNELESSAVQIATKCHLYLGDHEEVKTLAAILARRKPIPIEVAHLARSRFIECKFEIVDRLRAEHGDEFEPRLWAAILESDVFDRPREAFEALLELVPDAQAPRQKDDVCKALFEVAQGIGLEALNESQEVARRVLNQDAPLLNQIQVRKCFYEGKIDQAGTLLESTRDESDPFWLQMFGFYLLETGKPEQSLEYIVKATEQIPHVRLLELGAATAVRCDRLQIAKELLHKLLSIQPTDQQTLRNAASVTLDLHDYGSAATHFEVLYGLQPKNTAYGLNYAGCLGLAGRYDESLSVFDELCRQDDPLLEALIGRAQVLLTLNRPSDAFATLDEVRADHWGSPEFLAEFTKVAHASDKDEIAGQAFNRLRQLHESGLVRGDLIRPMTLDDVIQHSREWKEHSDYLHRQVIIGRVPWLFVDQQLNNVSYWGWRMRTQPLEWVSDFPEQRATYTIYSTNGYSAVADKTGRLSLERITCAPPNTTVTIDLSALITLHHLDLLKETAKYFGKLLVPTSYLRHAFNESGRLVPHQLSRKSSREEIKMALDDCRVLVHDNAIGEAVIIHEYSTDNDVGQHFYRLHDIADTLHNLGRITDDEYKRLRLVAHKASGVDHDHPELVFDDDVVIRLSSLETITTIGVLAPVLECFRVRILDEDRIDLQTSLRTFSAQEQVRSRHSDLWGFVVQDPRVVPTTHTFLKRDDDGLSEDDALEMQVEDQLAISATLLAEQHRTPLLSDDRFCQALLLNARRNESHAAFGSDLVVEALHQADIITDDMAADAFLALVELRYRFLTPSATVLKVLLDRFIQHPPGNLLQRVALYCHDCMRDPGLLGGKEATEPPMPMAFRLFQRWCEAASLFVASVWLDDSIDVDTAEHITLWTVSELLPSLPRSMAQDGIRLAEHLPRTVMSHILVKLCETEDHSRANAALRCLAGGLGLSDEQFLRMAGEIIDAF